MYDTDLGHSLMKNCSHTNNCGIQLYDTDLQYSLMKHCSYKSNCGIQLYDTDLVMMMMMMNYFCGMVDLFLVGTIVRDPHHPESLTRRD